MNITHTHHFSFLLLHYESENYFRIAVGGVVSWLSSIKMEFSNLSRLSERIFVKTAKGTERNSKIWCSRRHRTKALLFTQCQHCSES